MGWANIAHILKRSFGGEIPATQLIPPRTLEAFPLPPKENITKLSHPSIEVKHRDCNWGKGLDKDGDWCPIKY